MQQNNNDKLWKWILYHSEALSIPACIAAHKAAKACCKKTEYVVISVFQESPEIMRFCDNIDEYDLRIY